MYSKGFTLIELIIAIFILSIGIVGIFGAYSAMVVATGDISNKFIATYLSQEGVEIVKNIRDLNWANISANPTGGYTWVDGLTGCTSGCEADYTTGISTQMKTWGISPDGTYGNYLVTDSTSGFYNYLGGTQTKFKRKITIVCLNDDGSVDASCSHLMKVSVAVYWDKKASLISPGGSAANGGGLITVEENLYKWK